jgi:hypothetical protein
VLHYLACLNCAVVRVFEFQERSWIDVAALTHAPVGTVYAWAIYKAFAQMFMIGYGETTAAPIVATSCVNLHRGFCARCCHINIMYNKNY